MADPVEAAAKAHCDFFGGPGWWDTGMIADTKPKALEAMKAAIAAYEAADDTRASPDVRELLKALEETAALYGTPGGPWNVPGDPGGWLERIHALIARAKEPR